MTDELVHHTRLSPNCNERKLPISMVVLHSTEMKPVETALDRLTDPEAGVSAHYLITEEGEVIQLVSEEKRAWHAGVSSFEGVEQCNDYSIGIELEGTEDGGYTAAQYRRLQAVLRALFASYPRLGMDTLVGHAEIAPQRKADPGPYFDWSRLLTNA